jgi:hypothetical protein
MTPNGDDNGDDLSTTIVRTGELVSLADTHTPVKGHWTLSFEKASLHITSPVVSTYFLAGTNSVALAQNMPCRWYNRAPAHFWEQGQQQISSNSNNSRRRRIRRLFCPWLFAIRYACSRIQHGVAS